MNPVKKLVSWWRGNTDPEAASEIEARRQHEEHRQTIGLSQNPAARQAGSSLLSAPTPDVLDPGREDSHHSH